VPESKIELLTELDGNIEFDAQSGEVSACGPGLPANVLAINLLVDVMTDQITTAEARERYMHALLEARRGEPPTDMREARFSDSPSTAEPRHIPASDGVDPSDPRQAGPEQRSEQAR
jgi:hypothetical protein